MGLNGLPDFEVLVNQHGTQALVTFPVIEANARFETMRQYGAMWTVLDGPGQWDG